MPYRPVRILLSLALGNALAYAVISGMSPVALLPIGILVTASIWWFASHRADILQSHAERWHRGDLHLRDTTHPRKQPRGERVLAAVLVLAGIWGLWMALSDQGETSRGHLQRFLHWTLGPQGAVVTAAIMSSLLLFGAAEVLLGVWWSSKSRSEETHRSR